MPSRKFPIHLLMGKTRDLIQSERAINVSARAIGSIISGNKNLGFSHTTVSSLQRTTDRKVREKSEIVRWGGGTKSRDTSVYRMQNIIFALSQKVNYPDTRYCLHCGANRLSRLATHINRPTS